MATTDASRGGGVIFITIVVSIILMLLPLPEILRFFRPEWVLMTLIYWAMALPYRVSVGTAWITGLFMDVIMGGGLGILAFAYALAIYLIVKLHLQLRQYPIWQQAFIIMSLILTVSLVAVITSPKTISWLVLLPVITSTILWPIVYAVLRKIRRTFHVR